MGIDQKSMKIGRGTEGGGEQRGEQRHNAVHDDVENNDTV